MPELTIDDLRAQVAKVSRVVGQTKFLPTRIAANAKTLRYVLHWLLEQTDFAPSERLAPFYIPNIDGVPFARDDEFADGQLAILNDNVQSADGSLAVLYEIQMPGEGDDDDDDDLDIAAGDGKPAAVPVREGSGEGDNAADNSGGKRAAVRKRGRNWVH
jgi:hypothetical protein